MTDENIEQECPECGALCLFDDGNYVASESIPVAAPSIPNTMTSTQAVGEPTNGIPTAFVQWFEREWASYLDKAFTDKVTSMAWALKTWRHLSTAPTTGSAPVALQELENIVNAKRFDHEHFEDDTAYADWVQSRARACIALLAASMGGHKND